ncbi:putative colanic acid biosynthesis UDP-glucose lipid carrier transferase [Spirosoma lacussanchae]|uniref:sugar transferase n=1 Tax=Spirosoma lacussanchae TaxID=1884249 RepID=UPI001109064E|nr:sugar transferase [Spirosoma lacussanchae]
MLSLSTSFVEPVQTEADTVSVPIWIALSKRLLDLVVSGLVVLLVLSWLIPILGLAIRLTSPGPMLFIQVRTGRNGRLFRCLKFRTMTYDPNAQFRQATKNDHRVTRIGAFLRKTNIDELPQVLNVLWGDMSLVGPRPHAIQHDAQFWNAIPGYGYRYAIKPGITGLAQVRGCRGETSHISQMAHRVRLDKFYIQKQSVLLDIKICWWTVKSMLRGNTGAW